MNRVWRVMRLQLVNAPMVLAFHGARAANGSWRKDATAPIKMDQLVKDINDEADWYERRQAHL